MKLYTVLSYNKKDNTWETVLETYSEQEAVTLHRRLQKQGVNAIIDYEETK